jgi:hypothetical protein
MSIAKANNDNALLIVISSGRALHHSFINLLMYSFK